MPLLLIGLVLYLDLASWSLGPFALRHSGVQTSDSRSATQTDQTSITLGGSPAVASVILDDREAAADLRDRLQRQLDAREVARH